MIKLKKTVMGILIFIAVALTYFIVLVCVAYAAQDSIKFILNGKKFEFANLTYGDLKNIKVKPNEVFIVIDGSEQIDITTCDCSDSEPIKSITVVVTDTDDICNFSVYGLRAGDSYDKVTNNLPTSTEHNFSGETDILMSRYVDKNGNVLIVGTDIRLDIVSYITIRVGK